MKRYQIGEKVKLVPVPNKYWGMNPVYEPFERIRIKGKSGWMIVQRQENQKISFYLENLYTGKQESFVSEDSGIESWEKIKKHLDYYETMPPEYRMQQQQHQHQPQPQVEQRKDNEPGWYEKFQEDSAKIEASFKAFSDQLEEKSKAIDFELATQKFSEIKSALDDFEQKLESVRPRISLAEIRQREDGQKNTPGPELSNDSNNEPGDE